MRSLEITAKLVHDDIMTPLAGISNVSEWCKKDACWDRLQARTKELKSLLPAQFVEELVLKEQVMHEKKSALKVQKIDSGIELQKKVMEITGPEWHELMIKGKEKGILTSKELSVLQIAIQIPRKIPSEKQSRILIEILKKALREGVEFNGKCFRGI